MSLPTGRIAPPRVILAAAVAGLAVLTACSSGPDAEPAAAEPTETVTPEPTEPPPPAPVVGERSLTATIVSHEDLLTDQAIAAPDDDAINALIDQVGALLDAHLDDLNGGGPGLLADLAAEGLFTSSTDTDVIGADLASADVPATAARYRMDVAYDGAPRWVTATIEVDRADGTTVVRSIVLESADPLVLLVAGAEA